MQNGKTVVAPFGLHDKQAADARDVVCVVSRWFGGVLLGPQRFALINNTGRTLLGEQGYLHKKPSSQQAAKRGPQSKIGVGKK